MLKHGEALNISALPPTEYLMRRTRNLPDMPVPGSIVREWVCPVCGRIYGENDYAPEYRGSKMCVEHGKDTHVVLKTYSVDVPVVKLDDREWH